MKGISIEMKQIQNPGRILSCLDQNFSKIGAKLTKLNVFQFLKLKK